MAAVGVKPEYIAGCMLHQKTGKPISRATLYRHFRDELIEGTKGCTAIAVITLVQEMKKGGLAGVMAAAAWIEIEEKRIIGDLRSQEHLKKH